MQLLDIKVPAMTRVQYANLASQEVWTPKIRIASALYPNLEFNTVKHGVRDCMIMHNVNPMEMDVISRRLAKDGMIIVPLQKEGSAMNQFGHHSPSYNGQGNYTYRAVVTRSMSHANDFVHAHHSRDDLSIGKLLGFPECCSKFFDEQWKAGMFDPIWQQAGNSLDSSIKKNVRLIQDDNNKDKEHVIRFRAEGEYYKTLSVFRYLGVRFISHIPCSFNCDASVEVANNWIQLAQDINAVGLKEALEVMSLPFEWSCLKGIAEVNTPVFKISTASVPCYPTHTIQQESDVYPEEAPKGIQFPWKYFK
jgi:hypothetical protein